MNLENPFSQTREKAKYALFQIVLEKHRKDMAAGITEIHKAVRGTLISLDPRELQMSISSLISRTNKDLDAQGLPRIVTGKETYTYQFDA